MNLAAAQSFELSPRLETKLKLTPAMHQSLHILQLPLADLKNYIENELLANPVLEQRDTMPETFSDDAWDPETRSAASDEGTSFERALGSRDMSLQEYLLHQIRVLEISDQEMMLAWEIIGNLDEDGYLRMSLDDIAERCGATIRQAEGVLWRIQTLDPPGIAARHLGECLLVQAKAKEISPEALKTLVVAVIEGHLEDVQSKKITRIAESLEVSLAQVEAAVTEIRKLDPKPGRDFGATKPLRIIPDVMICRRRGRYEVVEYDKDFPVLFISPVYRKLLGQKDTSDATKEYIRQKLTRALSLIKAISERKKTLERIARLIVNEQKEFFEKGTAHLRPMTLERAADLLELHKSTLSRATRTKYVETPQGVFELKMFFSGAVCQKNTAHSQEAVKSRLQSLIRKEDFKKPLSDRQIAELLAKQGIPLARRTVAKYRDELRILPACLRIKDSR